MTNGEHFLAKCIKDNEIGGVSGEYVKITNIDKAQWQKLPTSHKKELSPYRCPDNHPLRPVMGNVKVYHFAHFGNAECKGESQEHIQSKIAIKKYLPKIKFKYCKGWRCPVNSKIIECKTQPHQFNNDEISEIEYSLKCTATYKFLDVGVLDNEYPICAIEVIKTSPTTEDKKKILQEKKIQLIEVNCYDVLEAIYKTKDIEEIIFQNLENTDNEIIIETCYIKHKNCNQCKKLYEERVKEVRELWAMQREEINQRKTEEDIRHNIVISKKREEEEKIAKEKYQMWLFFEKEKNIEKTAREFWKNILREVKLGTAGRHARDVKIQINNISICYSIIQTIVDSIIRECSHRKLRTLCPECNPKITGPKMKCTLKKQSNNIKTFFGLKN